ncbi:MAG TPA: NUDIX domain-containing protein [Candidatus Binatia bacterium]|nr:NUDIX domain-containing protein [Candidatus Binatia bacterium]
MISLATGLAVHEGRVLLVASRYPNHADPLWNLPGGRQQRGELLKETVVREVFEETGLRVEVGELAYVSESYDGAIHFLNVTFNVMLQQARHDTGRHDARSDHVVTLEWVPIEELAERIVVRVVREPLLGYLRGALPGRYAGYHDAGITIEWPADSQ